MKWIALNITILMATIVGVVYCAGYVLEKYQSLIKSLTGL